MASLVGGLLRLHERQRWRLVALELKTAGDVHQAKVKAGSWRQDLRGRFERWVDLSETADGDAALAIQRERVHILVDLNGLSKGGRQGLLLRRPAPLSLTFLGYPATCGGCVDMLVADRNAAPPELQVPARG